ncbi:MAG: tyrosine/phenylalanine carboxypeptidase domain-containing protein [Myxococcota bacterium]
MTVRPSNAERRQQRAIDDHLTRVALEARSLVERVRPLNLDARASRIAALRRRERLPPLAHGEPGHVSDDAWRSLEEGRRLAREGVMAAAYDARFGELELELRMVEAVGSPALVDLSLKRFDVGPPLVERAGAMLSALTNASDEPEDLLRAPAVAQLFRDLAEGAELRVSVRIEPSMTSLAAAGERTVYLSDRPLPRREALRIAVHELLGHLTSSANSRLHRFDLPRAGSAGSLRDQEGLALQLEAESGLLSAPRLRRVLGRTVAVQMLREGANFSECALALHDRHGLPEDDAVDVATRAYRGGGFARDAIYLRGWQRVRRALIHERSALDWLRLGRFSVDDVGALGGLLDAGWLSPARYKPSLSRSLSATGPGTSSETLPPSLAASLMILDET